MTLQSMAPSTCEDPDIHCDNGRPRRASVSSKLDRRVSIMSDISVEIESKISGSSRRSFRFDSLPSSAMDSAASIHDDDVMYSKNSSASLNSRFLDRESHTSDLNAFDVYLQRLQSTERTRADKPLSQEVWTAVRECLSTAKGVGYNGLLDPEAVEPKGPNDSMAFLGKVMSTALVHPINPPMLAKEAGVSTETVVTEMFHATKIGMVKMKFAPECERCGTAVCLEDKLSAIPAKAVCGGCRVENNITALDDVKVIFRLNEDILYVNSDNFPCQPSSASMAENLVFAIVPTSPTGSGIRYSAGCGDPELMVGPSIPPGKYRMHCPVAMADAYLTVEGDAVDEDDTVELKFHVSDVVVGRNKCAHHDANSPSTMKHMFVPHGKIHFDVHNDTRNYFVLWVQNDVEDEIIYRLPQEERFPYTSAAEVMHHPLFHHHFPGQLVRTTSKFEIERVVIVFTDVVGSTNLYSKLGDGEALDVITKHFEVLFKAFTENGRVVKTVGDAVMGSFTNGSSAIEAVSKAIQNLGREVTLPDGQPLQIRVGIHAGSTVVVPVNAINDYFGQTVNIAARVEGAAQASEVLITDAVFDNDPDAKAAYNNLVAGGSMRTVLAASGGSLQFEETVKDNLILKGVSHPVQARGFRYVGEGSRIRDSRNMESHVGRGMVVRQSSTRHMNS